MALNTAEKLIAEAQHWVGYIGKKTPENLDSFTDNAGGEYTVFAEDFNRFKPEEMRRQTRASWAILFIQCMFVYAFGLEDAKKLLFGELDWVASNIRERFLEKGLLFYTPRPGDIVFFYHYGRSMITHAGIVEKLSKDYMYCIEGNTFPSRGIIHNGNQVARKAYPYNQHSIAGFARPQYDINLLEAVRDFQTTLNVADTGVYDDATKSACISALQDAFHVPTTGIYDSNTHEAFKVFIERGERTKLIPILCGLLSCHGYGTVEADKRLSMEISYVLKQFQEDNGLTPNGGLNRITLRKLLGV